MNSAAGSSDREMSKIEDSISYKLNALKETWVGFLQVAANRAYIKIIIDFLTKVSELLVKVLEMPGANVAGISVAVGLLMTLVQKAKDAASPLLTLSSIFKELFGKESPLSNVQNVEKGVIETVNKMKETAESGVSPTQKTIWGANGQALTVVDTEITKANTEANLKNAASNEAKAASEIKDSAVKKGNIATTEADSAATEKNTAANKNNIASLLSLAKAHKLATGGIIIAVAAITTIITLYQKEKQSVEDLASSVEELGETYQTNKKQIGGNISSVQSLYKEYQQLASGVDALGNNKGLSDENFDKYNDLTNQIAEKMPNLVQGWTDQGNAILVCKDNVTALNEEIEREQRKIYTDVTDKESDILENYQNIINGHYSWLYNTSGTEARKTQLQSAQKQIAELKKIISNQNSNNNSFESYEYALKNPDASKRGSSYVLSDDFKKSSEIANQISTKWDSIIGHLNSLGVNTSKFDIQTDTIQSWDDLYNVITKVEKETLDVSSDVQEEEKSAVNDIQNLADAYLHLNDNYDKMSDGMKNGISTMINNLDVSAISDLGLDGDVAVGDFINGIVNACNSDTKVGNAITQLFSIDKNIPLSQAEIYIETYKKAILNALQNSKLDEETKAYLRKLLDLSDVDWVNDEKEMAGSASENAIDFNFQSEKAKLFGLENQRNRMDNQGADTSAIDKQIEEQQKVISSAEEAKKVIMDAYNDLATEAERQDFVGKLNEDKEGILANAEAAQKFVNTMNSLPQNNADGSFNLTGFSSTIDDLNAINEAYQKVAKNISKGKIGKEITSSISDVQKLREKFDALGDAVDYGDYGNFDGFVKILTDSSTSAEQMQTTWNDMYTAMAQAELEQNKFDESTKALVSSQLQQAGATKQSADQWVQYQVAEKQAADAGINLSTVTASEINSLVQTGTVSADCKQQLALLALQTQLTSNTVLDTASSRDQLYALAEAAGLARDEIAGIYNDSGAQKLADKAKSTKNSDYRERLNAAASEANQSALAKIRKKVEDAKADLKLTPTVSTGAGKSSGGGGKSGSSKSEEKDKYVEEFEKQYKELGELRDNDKIDEYEYCQYLRALYEKYFKDKKKYIEQYQKYESEYLSKMKSVYENIFSGLSSKIDDRISKLDKQKSKETSAVKAQKTAAVSALKAQKQAAVNAIEVQIKALKEQQKQIQKQIDAYQEQIDAINDANDARERELALQKALYDLDKLQNQRTNLTYSESQGMHYESDLSGIRDARESVQDAKDDIEIANIQKKIDLLNKEKDILDDQIDALNDKKDAIEDYYDTLIDETEAYYDNLVTQIEEAYEKETENLNNAKERLDKIKEYFSDAKLAAQISEMTGQSVNSIIDAFQTGDEKFLDSLQLQYAEVIKDMMADNQTFLDSFSEVSNIDMSGVTGFLEKTQDAFKGIENTNFDVVKDGIKSVEEAFASLDDKMAVSNLFGSNADFAETAKEAAEKAGTTFTSSLSNFFESDESAFGAGKEAVKKVAEGMTSDEAKTEVESKGKEVAKDAADKVKEAATSDADVQAANKEAGKAVTKSVAEGMTSDEAKTETDSKGKEVATNAANSVKTAATSDPDVQAANEEAGKAVTSGVGKGMVSDDAKAETDTKGKEVATAAANSVKTAATSDADVQAASKEAGKTLSTNIIAGATESLSDSEFQEKLQAFVDGIAQKIQEAFSKLDTSNLLDFSSMFSTVDDASKEGQSTSSIFSQMLQDVQNFATEFANIDISPVVQQFSDLRDAVVETSEAITGTGGTSSGVDQTTGGPASTGSGKKGGKQSSSAQSKSGNGGSLADAMQAFGDTSAEVLGGGGEEGGDDEGSGVIGQFSTLKTKVEEVTAAIGLGDEAGGGKSGGKSGGKGAGTDDGSTLVTALQAEGEATMDEEIGLPKQIEEWGKVTDGINQCIDALNKFKEGLEELESFTITVEFSSEFGEATGTMSQNSGEAHFQGTAFARGTAGLKHDQRALVGEQGPEMKISGNKWTLVGQHGAEYANLKAGDIIFSAAQTKELMKHGRLHSRGRTVGGNAYADGTPVKNALKFAGTDYSSAQLASLAAQLTGSLNTVASGMDSVERNTADLARNMSSVTNNSANQETNVTIGDIYLQGVNSPDSMAKAIKSYLPGAMLQQLHKT